MSNQQANNAGSSRSTNRVVGWCLAGVVGMFAFGFAMVPGTSPPRWPKRT